MASLKLSLLFHDVPFVDLPQKKILFNVFFQSQFSYCPLVWMQHSRILNNKIYFFKMLRLICNDKNSTFHERLKKDGPVSIYTQNLRFLAQKTYTLAEGISPPIMLEIFRSGNNRGYNLWRQKTFEILFRNYVYIGTESISCSSLKVWELVPDYPKSINSVTSFKEKTKKQDTET